MDEFRFWNKLRSIRASGKKLSIKDELLIKYKDILEAIEKDIKLTHLSAEQILSNITSELNKLEDDWKLIEGD